MAGNAPKKFHKLFLTFDEEQRNARIKDARVLPFGEIMEAYKEANGGKDLESVSDLKAFIAAEVRAMDNAHYATDIKKAYETDAKGNPRDKTVGFVSDFFEAEDEFLKKYDDYYNEYLSKKREAEGVSDETERNIRLNELKNEYKDAIASFNKCDDLYKKVGKYEETLKFLNALPEKVLSNVVEAKKNCDDKGCGDKFEEVFADMVSQPAHISSGKQTADKEIENEHRFNVGKDNDVVTHTIRNLNGSGLDIVFTGGEFSIACFDENMTQEQVNALAEYCYRYGITIKDFGDLKGKQVVDKDNKEVGEIEPVYEQAIRTCEENDHRDRQVDITPAVEDSHVNNGDDYFGPFIDNSGEIKEFDYKKVKSCTQKILTGITSGAVADYSHGFGFTTVSIYDSEEDRDEDGKIDKNNKIKHKKNVAITFDDIKNKATFYIGPKGKLTTPIVRIALDTAKSRGFKYFEIPPVDSSKGFGAPNNKVFFEASVKARMPLLLKGPSGKGCDIGAGDVVDILSFVNDKDGKEFNGKENEKVEYLMRFYQQLEKYTKANPRKMNELADEMSKVKDQANFTYFQKTYKGSIEGLISEGIKGNNGEKWDDVDIICAIHAYDKVIKDIQEGKLGNKRYNPMDMAGNNELIKKEFERYRKSERKNVEKKIDEELDAIKRDETERSTIDKAINNVKARYLGNESDGHNKTLKFLKANGIDISIDFQREKAAPYNPKYRRTANNTNSSPQAVNPAYLRSGR